MDAPKTVEEIYEDFCGRRAALVAALTTGARRRATFCEAPHCAAALCLAAPLSHAVCWRPSHATHVGVDVAAFFEQCDPNKENLCLYGRADGTWRVELPAEEVPPELPEPALGVNFARDGMAVRAP